MSQLIAVQFSHGGHTLVVVEEFLPYEPSAYVNDPGWTCIVPGSEREIFVSTDGTVYDGVNDVVGVAPEIKLAADRLEAQLAQEPDDA